MDSLVDLSRRLIQTAQSLKATHERIAETMERLAEAGGEQAAHRRAVADQARLWAEQEATHLAILQVELEREIALQARLDRRGGEPGAAPGAGIAPG